MIAADFNSDGNPDLAIANQFGGTVSVLLGNANGTFQSNVEYTTGSQPWGVASGDFNGDGNADLVVIMLSQPLVAAPVSLSVYVPLMV